jgi:hypothetical protein
MIAADGSEGFPVRAERDLFVIDKTGPEAMPWA